MTPEQAAAVARVRKYLSERMRLRGIDHEHIHGLNVGHETRECDLTSSDLSAILAALDAAQAPREMPRLTPADIESVIKAVGIEGYDERSQFARAVESRVRELCGVKP